MNRRLNQFYTKVFIIYLKVQHAWVGMVINERYFIYNIVSEYVPDMKYFDSF